MAGTNSIKLNKHIFSPSGPTEFYPNIDYSNMARRDIGGSAFFFGGASSFSAADSSYSPVRDGGVGTI